MIWSNFTSLHNFSSFCKYSYVDKPHVLLSQAKSGNRERIHEMNSLFCNEGGPMSSDWLWSQKKKGEFEQVSNHR